MLGTTYAGAVKQKVHFNLLMRPFGMRGIDKEEMEKQWNHWRDGRGYLPSSRLCGPLLCCNGSFV